jgi:hypothetical protein
MRTGDQGVFTDPCLDRCQFQFASIHCPDRYDRMDRPDRRHRRVKSKGDGRESIGIELRENSGFKRRQVRGMIRLAAGRFEPHHIGQIAEPCRRMVGLHEVGEVIAIVEQHWRSWRVQRDERLRHRSEERFPDNFLANRKSRRERANKPVPHVVSINAKTALGTREIPSGQPVGNRLVEVEEGTCELALRCDGHDRCSSRDALCGAIEDSLRRRLLPQQGPMGYVVIPLDEAGDPTGPRDHFRVETPYTIRHRRIVRIDQQRRTGVIQGFRMPTEMDFADCFYRKVGKIFAWVQLVIDASNQDIVDIEQQTAACPADDLCQKRGFRDRALFEEEIGGGIFKQHLAAEHTLHLVNMLGDTCQRRFRVGQRQEVV